MKGWTQSDIDKLSLRTSEKEKVKNTKAKVKTLPQLITILDDLFSIWVRRSNEDEQGIIRCVTCSRFMVFNTAQAGHYVGRQYKAVRWEIKNVAPQCGGCNGFNGGEPEKFAIAIDKKYGEGTAEMLRQKKNNRFKLERFVLETLIAEYKEKIKKLPNHKN